VSTSPIDDDRFIRNPVLQVRAFGTSRPVVFVKRYVGPSDSRHPSTVSLSGLFTGAVDSGAAAAGLAVVDAAAFAGGVFFIEAAEGVFWIEAGAAGDAAAAEVADPAGVGAALTSSAGATG
jgi:hypothetical protein